MDYWILLSEKYNYIVTLKPSSSSLMTKRDCVHPLLYRPCGTGKQSKKLTARKGKQSKNLTARKGTGLFQPIPGYSCQFQRIPAYSSPFQPIPAISSLFQPMLAYSGIFQSIPAYSNLFQHIRAYSRLFKPSPA